MNRLRLEGSDRGWKGLTAAGRAKKELAESEVADQDGRSDTRLRGSGKVK